MISTRPFKKNRDSGMLNLVVNTLILKSLKVHLTEEGKGEAIDPITRREIWTMTNGTYSATSHPLIVCHSSLVMFDRENVKKSLVHIKFRVHDKNGIMAQYPLFSSALCFGVSLDQNQCLI